MAKQPFVVTIKGAGARVPRLQHLRFFQRPLGIAFLFVVAFAALLVLFAGGSPPPTTVNFASADAQATLGGLACSHPHDIGVALQAMRQYDDWYDSNSAEFAEKLSGNETLDFSVDGSDYIYEIARDPSQRNVWWLFSEDGGRGNPRRLGSIRTAALNDCSGRSDSHLAIHAPTPQLHTANVVGQRGPSPFREYIETLPLDQRWGSLALFVFLAAGVLNEVVISNIQDALEARHPEVWRDMLRTHRSARRALAAFRTSGADLALDDPKITRLVTSQRQLLCVAPIALIVGMLWLLLPRLFTRI